jgi:hypothetical protein
MNILVSGCSFTQWPEYPGGPNICWPRFLKELNPDWNITSRAEAAAGNQYIADSVVRAVLEQRPERVLVMWSGVSRLDYLTSLEDPAWDKLFDSYGFYRRLPDGKLGYIFSGGQMGTWFKNPVAHKMFYEMYKVSSELSLATINLMEIVKTQQFLKSMNVPYHFMSYVNYWTTEKNISPNGDFGLAALPELAGLLNAVDFSKWIFSDSSKNGIYELAKQNNDFQADGFHPGDNTQRQWAELINSVIRTTA